MRKGLVTLGVVTLVLAVSSSFAEAPILSCLPDIVISDVEQNSQTDDLNLFIFSDAIDLNEYVEDPDTSDSLLAWSGLDPSGSISINDILLVPPLDTLNPGAKELTQTTSLATFKNETWMGIDPGAGATTETMIELYVSDATTVTQASMLVTTVNAAVDVGDPDAVIAVNLKNYQFTGGAEGWTWFEIASLIIPAHNEAGGTLSMTEAAGHDNIVFGAYESPRDPALAIDPKLGCIMRARYEMTVQAASATVTPGLRLRGLTAHVAPDPTSGDWEQDFLSEDYTSDDLAQYGTIDFAMGGGDFDARAADQTFELMVFPRQVSENLESEDPASPVVTYVSADLLDLEGSVENDAGTWNVESVVVDGVNRPSIGMGTAVPAMSFSDFSTGWSTGIKALAIPINQAGLSVNAGADLTITVGTQSENFDAYAEMTDGETMIPGNYYRIAFVLTSTEQPGGDKGPTARCVLVSSRFVYSANKTLQGGALLTHLSLVPSLMELWVHAPAEMASTPGATEAMKIQFESYLGLNVPQWPDFRSVSGTLTCTDIITETFAPGDL